MLFIFPCYPKYLWNLWKEQAHVPPRSTFQLIDSGMSCGYMIFVRTPHPSFLCFNFPGNHSSNMCALLGKQDYGAQGKRLCCVTQVDPARIMKVQNLHIQVEFWEKINWHKAKQKIGAPLIAMGLIWPKWIGFGIEIHGVLRIFYSAVLCSCISAFQEGVIEASLVQYQVRSCTPIRAIICIF